MDTRILKYFLTVAREKNITKAADTLHITQPTLSRQLAKLEEDMGVPLFIRGKKGISLTNEGLLFRRRAEEIVELTEKTRREISEDNQLINGEISIGSGELASVQLISELFISFKKKFPNVYLNLYTGNADHIKQRIDNGLTDIGILLEPVDMEKYQFIRLNVTENWVVVMKANDQLAKNDYVKVENLIKLPLIMPHRQVVRNEIESWFSDNWNKLHIVATNNLSTNAMILVEKGLGYAIVIEGSLPFLDKTKVTYRPLYPQRTTTAAIAWKKQQPLSPAVAKFIEHIKCNFCMDSNEI